MYCLFCLKDYIQTDLFRVVYNKKNNTTHKNIYSVPSLPTALGSVDLSIPGYQAHSWRASEGLPHMASAHISDAPTWEGQMKPLEGWSWLPGK